jgi:Fic family protein
VHQQLAQRPISDVKALALAAGVSPQATTKALAQLKKLGVVRPVSKRVVAYGPLVDLLQNDLPL